MSNKLPETFFNNLRDLKHDVGFQSRYFKMEPDYVPLVERVNKLEEVLDALLYHLDLEALYKVSATTIRERTPKTEDKGGRIDG